MSAPRVLWVAPLLSVVGCINLGLPGPLGVANSQLNDVGRSAARGAARAAVAPTKACVGAELAKYDLNPDQEYWFGRSVADRLLAPYANGRVYDPDSLAAIYLNEVGEVVADGAARDRDDGGGITGRARRFAWTRKDDVPDRPPPEHGYRFILVRDPNPGAWATPGGFVIVTDGLVARAASEDQLGAILAHEISHVQRGHGVEGFMRDVCEQKNSKLAAVVRGAGEGAANGLRSAGAFYAALPLDKLVALLSEGAQHLATSLTTRGYGTAYELEADAYGTRYAANAGYAPGGIASYLRRVSPDPAFSTARDTSHPPLARRIEALDAQLTAERLGPAESPSAHLRRQRFVDALRASKIRPDWRRATDPAKAPLMPPAETAAR